MLLLAEDYKQLPPEMRAELIKMLGWLVWTADLVCLCWLFVGACRYFALKHSTVETLAEAHNGIARSLVAAVMASSAMAVATAVLIPG